MTIGKSRIRGKIMALGALVALALTPQVTAQESVKATLASVNNPDFLAVRAMSTFADLVREKTGGTLDITVAAGGSMGGMKENLEAVITGSLEAAHVSSSLLGAVVPELQLFELPFLFRDNAHMATVLRGEIGQSLYAQLEGAAGIKMLMVGLADGPRSVWNTQRPIRTPADLSGLKLRLPENAVMLDTFRALGALPTAMPFSEVYMAAKQGVIDGAETPPYGLPEARVPELAKFYSLTQHITLTAGLAVNAGWFNGLSPEHQQAMVDAGAEASAWYDSQFDAANAAALEAVVAEGMEVNEVDDLEAFRAAVAPVYDQYAPIVGGAEAIQSVIETE